MGGCVCVFSSFNRMLIQRPFLLLQLDFYYTTYSSTVPIFYGMWKDWSSYKTPNSCLSMSIKVPNKIAKVAMPELR